MGPAYRIILFCCGLLVLYLVFTSPQVSHLIFPNLSLPFSRSCLEPTKAAPRRSGSPNELEQPTEHADVLPGLSPPFFNLLLIFF